MGTTARSLPADLVQPGCLEYGAAWALQRRLLEERLAERCPDTLVLLEHEPVFTAGRTARADHWGGDESATRVGGIPIVRVERGGSVTYHGPGQLVGYPVLKLNRFCDGPRTYVRGLEDVIIGTLARWGITGRRVDKQPGVWIGGSRPAKIAAVGTRIDRGITMHGFALNVTVDLRPFSLIVPCGIPDCRVTSMAELVPGSVDPAEVRRCVADRFAEVFGLEWTEDRG